jgi:biotin transport system ATP-binding protein
VPSIELEAAGVTVPVAGGVQVLLHPTTLQVTEQRVAVIGGNGSGKSTMARLVNGLVEADTGRVLVEGLDVARHGAAVRRRVAFTFTDPAAQLVMPTCVEDVELSLRRRESNGRRRRVLAEAVLERFGLGDLADRSVHVLSGGQKQLLALAGALATDPAILVADEPTTLLDLANSRLVADVLLALPQQLLLVTHDLDLAERCERVLVIEDARVVFDGPAVAGVAHYRASVSR